MEILKTFGVENVKREISQIYDKTLEQKWSVCEYMKPEVLKKLQQTELSIMAEIDKLCKENEIKYSLYAGTAIGAVRHGGFIPWDDDIDICMERKYYDKFIKLWKEKAPEGYYLQNPLDFDTTNINHAKVRKDGTAFISSHDKNIAPHNGIWIDIFPFDRVPSKKIKQLKVKFFAVLCLVYTRGYPMSDKGALFKLITRIMLLLPKKAQKRIRGYGNRYITKYSDLKKNYDLMCLSFPASLKRRYSADMLENVSYKPFENTFFMLTDKFDEMLTTIYGDYMKLPPEEQRVCIHNPEEILFDS